jgi:hypothetical protein
VHIAIELVSPTFLASRGSPLFVFDVSVVSRIDKGFATVGRPPHQVRGSTVLPTDFHDIGIPWTLTNAMTPYHQPIAGFGSHVCTS